MENLIIDNISLILMLPLWIFLIIMCGRFFAVYVNNKIIYFLTLFASLLGAGICGTGLLILKDTADCIYPFIQINDFNISFGLQIDHLSLIIGFILFTISFAVQLFSISHMRDEKKKYRFFALLNLFNFCMAFMLFSPNLYQFYVFWELVGIISYLLIGFDYKNIIKSNASKRVFIINRIGDTALIAGIILTTYYMFEYVGNKSFITLSFQDLNAISTFLMAYTSDAVFYIISGLFLFAAIVKSAQFPFYNWLQDAMEAKTPVSALLHSATMVIAGVYLIIRTMPFFTLHHSLMNIIFIIGILTALICSILASIETHPKKILAYSTSANLGLMFTALGLGYVKTAIFFLAVHAYIKSALFLTLPNEKNLSKINYILFCISALSLAGLLFGGIGAKELLYKNINSDIFIYLYLLICFITAFYITRLSFLIYKKTTFINNTNISELISFLILLFGNLSLYYLVREKYHIAEPYAAAIGGFTLAVLMNKNNSLEKFINTPKILEKLYYDIIPVFYLKFAQILEYIETKILSDYKPMLKFVKMPVIFANWIEINIMNKTVTFIGECSKQISKQNMILQSGNIQTYNAYAFIIITAITILVVISFWILTRMF